jgi:adenine-specific DNA-methyltransferase
MRTMVKYIGSKRALLPWISSVVTAIHEVSPIRTVVDLFSGSARVGHALKARGFYVISNDYLAFAFTLAQALVEADGRVYTRERVEPILRRLERVPPRFGWFTENYCERARYFQPKNGAKIEAIREVIEEEASGDPILRAILLTSLLIAADKVDSTTGVQMAFLKKWSPRSYNDLALEYPPVLPGEGKAFQGDALKMAPSIEGDLFYLDPPYNQHSYLGNYHVWETLILWDKPVTYGIANKRLDVKLRKSPFNLKAEAKSAMEKLLASIRSRNILLSFNSEGFLKAEEIMGLLSNWGYVLSFSRTHSRYIGYKIGVYNPNGEKVGEASHSKNTEYLFLATRSKAVYDALLSRFPSAGPKVSQPSLF